MGDKIISRDAEQPLRQGLGLPYIVALIGARQVGKSTLLRQLIPSERTLSVNFDSGEVRDRVLADPHHLLKQLEVLNQGPLTQGEGPLYLCVDESQKLPEAFEIVKQLHDQFSPRLKIILSGSSSLLIKQHAAETLAGRIRFFHLHPFSLEEAGRFVGFKESGGVQEWVETLLSGRMTDRQGEEIAARKRYLEVPFRRSLDEWSLWGMMPPRFHLPSESEWILLLRDYVDTYLEKDMRATERIGSLGEYKKLVRWMGDAIGNLVNFSEIGKGIGLHRQTVKEYLQILDESLLGLRLSAFSESVPRRIVKAEKSYLLDNGLAYYFMDLKSLEVLEASGRIGALYENLIVSEFKKRGSLLKAPLNLYYWRLSGPNPPEVDLVCDHRGTLVPIEIKHQKELRGSDLRGLRHFMQSFRDKKSYRLPYGVVCYRGPYRYLKEENIFLIPDWFFV